MQIKKFMKYHEMWNLLIDINLLLFKLIGNIYYSISFQIESCCVNTLIKCLRVWVIV